MSTPRQNAGTLLGPGCATQRLCRRAAARRNPNNENAGYHAAVPPQFPSRQTETSSIEGRFHELDTPYKLYTAPTAGTLEQFGYDFFSTRVSSFAPIGNVPVGDDYIVGPDDELNVYNWGRVNQTDQTQGRSRRRGDGSGYRAHSGRRAHLRTGKETHRRPDESNHRRRSRRDDGPDAHHPGLRHRKGRTTRTLYR